MKTVSDETFKKMVEALRAAQYEATCMEPRLQGSFRANQKAIKEQCGRAAEVAEAAQIEIKELLVLRNCAFISSIEGNFNSGGNCMIDFILLKDGRCIGITEDCAVLYPTRAAFNEPPEEMQNYPAMLFPVLP